MVIYNSNDLVSESMVYYPSSKFPHQEFYKKALANQRKIYSNDAKQKEEPHAVAAVDARLKEAFSDPTAYFLVFLEDDKPTGVVTVYPRKEYVFLFELQVLPQSRYAAIAKKLLHFVVQKFKGKPLFGVVHRSNPMIHTYWKLGCSESHFQEYDQWRQQDGWVALVYSASFTNETHLSRLNSLADCADVGNEAGNEAIQDTTGISRPVFLIQDDAVVNEPNKWMYTELMRTPDSLKELNKKLRCIGAVEHADGSLVGTCWMIHPGFVCTTKHIAAEFYTFTADGEVTGRKEQAVVNFGREYDRPDEPAQRFSVEKVAFVDKEQDLAILKLQDFSGSDWLVVEGAAFDQWKYLVEDEVFVVGYPARDVQRNPEKLVNQVFGNVFEKKRLAFGKLTNYNKGDVFQHSASTLAGNAGSPVLGAKSLRVLGVHTGGMFNEGNQCVAFPKLREMFAAFLVNIK